MQKQKVLSLTLTATIVSLFNCLPIMAINNNEAKSKFVTSISVMEEKAYLRRQPAALSEPRYVEVDEEQLNAEQLQLYHRYQQLDEECRQLEELDYEYIQFKEEQQQWCAEHQQLLDQWEEQERAGSPGFPEWAPRWPEYSCERQAELLPTWNRLLALQEEQERLIAQMDEELRSQMFPLRFPRHQHNNN